MKNTFISYTDLEVNFLIVIELNVSINIDRNANCGGVLSFSYETCSEYTHWLSIFSGYLTTRVFSDKS